MTKSFKTGFTAFMGVCLITTMLSACGTGKTTRAPDQRQDLRRINFAGTTPQPGQNRMLGINPGNGIVVTPGANQGNGSVVAPGVNQLNQQLLGQPMTQNRQKSENIKSQLKNMKEITDANVIVIGNTALVGYKPSVNPGDVNVIRNMITNKVKQADRSITNVMVSGQPDMTDRMNRLENDITNNRPMKGITDGFNQIIREINPATPQ